jgi:cardiolipin synthase
MSRLDVLTKARQWLHPHVAEGDWAYVRRPERLQWHSAVQPLRGGGEAFPAMLTAIAAARQRVHLETYILRDDAVGRVFAAALGERAQAGVEVRLLIDSVGCLGLASSFLDNLRQHGVHVCEFHPVAPWRPRHGLNTRDHKKILVVDDCVGFIGGLNLGAEYEDTSKGGGGWYDWHAQDEGPVVQSLSKAFAATWLRAGGASYALPTQAPTRPESSRLPSVLGAKVIVNEGLRERFGMHLSYLHAIRAARHEIAIMNAYFIPTGGLRRALARAVQRGVRVRIVVPGQSDVAAVAHAARFQYTRLLKSGIELHRWPGMMHAKFAVIDGLWTTIGSYNLDRRSIEHNLEAGLVVLDRPLGERVQAQFETDVGLCTRVTMEEMAARSWWERSKDAFWHSVRYWL